MVCLGKPAPKLYHKPGFFFCLEETVLIVGLLQIRARTLYWRLDNPNVFQAPSAMNREQLVIRDGPSRVASGRRAYEGITNAITNSFLLGKIYELGSPSLAMVEIRRQYVPSDDLDKQSHLREYISVAMIDGEKA